MVIKVEEESINSGKFNSCVLRLPAHQGSRGSQPQRGDLGTFKVASLPPEKHIKKEHTSYLLYIGGYKFYNLSITHLFV